MPQALPNAGAESFLSRGFSRRQLGKIASVFAAGASLPFYNESAFAQRYVRGQVSEEAVKINQNENPLGPCPEALEAINAVARFGGRYSPHDETGELVKAVSAVEGLKPNYVSVYAGSSDPLQRVVCAYCSPSRGFVMGDPGYESGASTATFIGAKAIHVPLRADHSHDVRAMVKADPNAGVIYICNPNNPTGTLTAREDIEYVIANMPKGCVLLLDEAYWHFTTIAKSGVDLVAADKDVIVLRTFSKVYGMAGLRAGLALGRPELIDKLRPYGPGFTPITGIAAATASVKVADLVPKRRKINADIRENTLEFLDAKGYKFTRSQSNAFMVDVRRPNTDVIAAMAKENVLIGRPWPIWPTWVRISVGTQPEMDTFKKAFAKVMA
jgi:histidinol-phosphate aminotransferase